MAHLSYVNVFARDVVALSGFYSEVFGFPEIEAIRSPIFRGIDAGGTAIGFNALDAYELLKLQDFAETKGVKFLLNIDVDTVDVDSHVDIGVDNVDVDVDVDADIDVTSTLMSKLP